MYDYIGVGLYILVGRSLGTLMLVLSTVLSPRRLDLEKATAYECGFDPFGEARAPFEVSFYLVAILFRVFDLEVAYLFPWVIGLSQTGWFGFTTMTFFLVILTVGFVYEWKKGALDWN
jgi:NADH:ubiquinone oxidoreductase subunit 3 (subunit A)